jgi:hypothetical protein
MKMRGYIVLSVVVGSACVATAQESRMLAICRPVSERTGPLGCWIGGQEPLGELPSEPMFWHLSTYSTRAAAEADKVLGRAGDSGFIVPADLPMQLTVAGTEQRRSLVLILHETGKPASGFDTKWVPKGLCNE